MPTPSDTIPFDRLPPGFVESLDAPPAEPAVPRPAATVVLMRRRTGGGAGLEVLLLRRVRSAGFVPGAWVFPGGRVDEGDSANELAVRTDGLDEDAAARLLRLEATGRPPALAYPLAALREAFEETGILLARDRHGRPLPTAAVDPRIAEAHDRLLADAGAFPGILDALGARLDAASLGYLAHWITPVVEPRRYDTRFFAAAVEAEGEVRLHEAETDEACWLSPVRALERHRAGELPMVFPTVRTLEALAPYAAPDEALSDLATRRIPTWLPRLVRTAHGVTMELDEL